ncbi:C40 family peptidase [Virgibacillus sp. MG-45]|uniref:C40 family peptidase n=1 Tax=Virgibacillus sp. MG-45 TaxID=3102791 RepID=UPI002ED9E7D2
MSNKKMYMSVTASAVIASSMLAAQEAEAASYKVQPGDSLWTIAQKYNTSVANLKKVNSLTSDLIYPNQLLKTTATDNQTPNKNNKPNNQPAKPTPSKTTTYTVKAGDTLSGIASKHKISLSELMRLNNLNSTLIYPGNVFVVSKSTTDTGNKGNASSNASSGNSSGTTNSGKGQVASSSVYVVKSGDTLSAIAARNGVTVANLKKWNKLKSDLILIGQKLTIGDGKPSSSSGSSTANGSTESNSATNGNTVNTGSTEQNEKPSANVSYNVNKLTNAAENLIGAPYLWAGSSPEGFDCSGFIYYAYKDAGMGINRLSTDGYYNRSFYVNKPQIGDLVFFSGTYRAGISHMGIYVGNNEFIHSGTSTGVTKSNLNSNYWKKHFDGFKRFY